MLTENRFGKYLFYAIGEILLVVIGILIAVEVNNWNEKRKDSKLELEILTGIKNDLEANIISLNTSISADSLVVVYAERLIEILKNETSEYDESMDKYFGGVENWSPMHPNKLAYTNLQSIGLSIISNDIIRSKIVQLFDETYLLQEDKEKIMIELFSNGISVNHRFLETREDTFKKRPNDFQALKTELEFKNYLTHTRGIRKQLLSVTENIVKRSTIELRNQINEEILRLEK
jgi:hypothetical protein